MQDVNLNSEAMFLGKLDAREKTTRAIDDVQLMRCLSIATFNPEVRACIDYIVHRVVCMGIEVRKDSMKEASPEFVKHVQDHYVAFVSDVLRAGLAVGVVPYTLVSNGKFKAPMVLMDRLKDIEVVSNGVTRSYSLRGKRGTAVFFEVFNHLSMDGTITSKVAALVRSHDHLMAQDTNAFIANELNARPPLFLTTGSASFSEINAVDNSGINAETEFNTQLLKNKIQMNVIRAQQMQAQYGAAADDVDRGPLGKLRDPLTGLPIVSYASSSSFTPDYVALPSDTRLHAHNVATAPASLVADRTNFRQLVTAVFGIPASVFGGGAVESGAAASIRDASIAAAIQSYKRSLSRLCLKCYSVSFQDATDDVSFVFPAAADRGSIMQLYNQGLIRHEYVMEYLSTSMEIPISAFRTEEDLMKARAEQAMLQQAQRGASGQERREPLGGGALAAGQRQRFERGEKPQV